MAKPLPLKNIRLTIDNHTRHHTASVKEENDHRFIRFSDRPRKGANTDAGFMIVEHFLKEYQSRNKWYKDERYYQIQEAQDNGTVQVSKPFNYLSIARYIRENGTFHPPDFLLPAIQCGWLDISIDLSFDAQFKDPHNDQVVMIADGLAQQNYGDSYPIKPMLDREGRSFSSLLPLLTKRLIKMRTRLVETSNLALTAEWFLDLRIMIADSISIVEIMLNQLYIKAQYSPLPGWKFDKQRLGDRHGRRFADKLKWIFQITGKNLNAESYLPAVENLREIRNHFMHFDPPSITLTLEEATVWMNQLIDIGYLMVKMRRAMGVEFSSDLINFILQKEVIFVPKTEFNGRVPLPQDGSAGYRSSSWPRTI